MGTNLLRPTHGITFGVPSNYKQTYLSGLNDQVLTFYHHGGPSKTILNVVGFALGDGKTI